MKNITLTVDDETWRQARIKAAELGTSVSALVRGYLLSMARPVPGPEQQTAELFAILDRAQPQFRAADRLSRDETHARR